MNLCKTCGTICPFDDERTECDAYAPMTNENWLRSCTTEQLAEWIYQERWTHSDGWYEQCGHTVKEVVEWLKKPHQE